MGPGPGFGPGPRPTPWRPGPLADWLWMGSTMLLLFGDRAAYKLNERDIRRVESTTGKSASDLTEAELLAAMRKLGIQKLELNDEERRVVEKSSAQPASTTSTRDASEALHELMQLHYSGLITEEEFEQKKAEILARL